MINRKALRRKYLVRIFSIGTNKKIKKGGQNEDHHRL
jgi:hypothetical protein